MACDKQINYTGRGQRQRDYRVRNLRFVRMSPLQGPFGTSKLRFSTPDNVDLCLSIEWF